MSGRVPFAVHLILNPLNEIQKNCMHGLEAFVEPLATRSTSKALCTRPVTSGSVSSSSSAISMKMP